MLEERRLWAAVIIQAIYDLDAAATGVRDFARRWFLSDNYKFGSFRWICDQLDLSASAVRRHILDRKMQPAGRRMNYRSARRIKTGAQVSTLHAIPTPPVQVRP
jgi:hypothetical protein